MNEGGKREVVAWGLCALLSLALTYLITLDRWGIHLWDQAIDYKRFGNWSNAISGIGTTAAVVIAFTAFCWERVNQRATERKRVTETETSVYQWLTSKEVRDESGKPIGRLWDLRIDNSTLAPIYHWRVALGALPDHLCNSIKRPLLPGDNNVFNLPFLDGVEPSDAPEPSLIFEARSGRTWRRSARGLVEKATPHELACAHTSGTFAST